MNAKDTIQSVTKFLELSLDAQTLSFFLDIKKSFGGDDELFCDFLYRYLTIQKGGMAPLEDKIYNDFCLYFSRFAEIQGENKILEQIARYAKYYLMLRLEYIDDDDFAKSISVVNSYEVWDVYPFLLELVDDFENQRIDKNALINMLEMVEDLAYKKINGEIDTDLASLGVDINKMLFDTNTMRNAG